MQSRFMWITKTFIRLRGCKVYVGRTCQKVHLHVWTFRLICDYLPKPVKIKTLSHNRDSEHLDQIVKVCQMFRLDILLVCCVSVM